MGTSEYRGAGTWTPPRKTALASTPPCPGRLVSARQVTSLQDGTLRILERATGHTGEPGCSRTSLCSGTPWGCPAMFGVLLPPPGKLHSLGCPPQPLTQGCPGPRHQPSPAPQTSGQAGCRMPGGRSNSGEGSTPFTLGQRGEGLRPPHPGREEVSAPPRARVDRVGRGLPGLGALPTQAMIRRSRGSVPAH